MNQLYRNPLTASLKLFAFGLLIAFAGLTSLHAQTVAYVVNTDINTVSAVDTATNTVIATVSPLGVTGPIGVVASPDGTRIYVTGSIGSGSGIDVIDTAGNTVIATIPLPAVSLAVLPSITPDGKHLYVPDNLGGTVTVINTATNAVAGAPIKVGASCNSLAITPDGTRVYVTDPADGTVVQIDTATNQVAGTPISLGLGNPNDLVITPDGGHIYVSVPTPGESTIAVIDTSNNTVVTQIPMPGSQELPFGLAITPDGSRVYVAEQTIFAAPILNSTPTFDGFSGVLVIDTSTNTVITTIFFGFRPYKVAITPDGTSVYVTDSNVNSVTVINTAKNTIVATTIPVGNTPAGIVIVNVSTPFAAFTVDDLEINHHRFNVQGDFTLGATSPGIDLAHQPVTLNVSAFSLTIPAGKFKQVGGPMHFIFRGTISGFKVDFDIQAERHSTDAFDFHAKVKGVDLASQPNPVSINLKVGHNIGTTSATFNQDSDDNDRDNN